MDRQQKTIERVRAEMDELIYTRDPESTRIIELGGAWGLCAIVSAVDYERVMEYPWHPDFPRRLGGNIYAATNMTLPDGRVRTVRMHRFVLGLLPTKQRMRMDSMVVDHICHQGSGLLNTRENLRLLSARENIQRRADAVAEAVAPC